MFFLISRHFKVQSVIFKSDSNNYKQLIVTHGHSKLWPLSSIKSIIFDFKKARLSFLEMKFSFIFAILIALSGRNAAKLVIISFNVKFNIISATKFYFSIRI